MAVLLKKTSGLRIAIPAAIIALAVLAGCSNSGNGPGGEVWVVGTLAGSGDSGYDNGGYADGTGAEARFNYPAGVAVDGKGNVYVGDSNNHRIRKISPEGVVSTLAGSGEEGYADGTGTEAQFYHPAGVAVDGKGNVYVADYGNHRIRKITPAGVVSTLAGSEDYGYADGTGTEAQFHYPHGVAVDGKGNVYVGDKGNHRIRKITPRGVVSTLAGSGDMWYADGAGTEAQFNQPYGVAVGRKGSVYVADSFNNRIRTITREKGGPGRNGAPGRTGSVSGKGGLAGTWESDDLSITMTWTFTGNKLTQEVMGETIITPYTIKGNAIAMEYEGVEVEFEYKIDGNTLTVDMYGNGVEFERVAK
jgi:sugar lactone lactonase YvrE